MKNPYDIIIRPIITEKSARLSYGNPLILDDKLQLRKYTFEVARDANKIEIKQAFEAIYNEGKTKESDKFEVVKVHTINVKGKTRRVNWRSKGKTSDRKKAVITLAKGQMLEDYGV